ncbi:MAG TPA: SRPBCC family protein [Polyangia bacterium]|nr:SRPBCC family protein [Polyangia bacterium]
MGAIADWGSTAEERAREYPCDRHVDAPDLVCFRAVDVAAPPSAVFRWLCQLRVAPYSYDWIDNFGRRSPRTRDPANEQLANGQSMMRIFRLVDFARDRHLTLIIERTRLFGALAVTYQVAPSPGGTRLVVKLIARLGRASLMRAILPLGDLIMMRKQLLTLKALAEREQAIQ